MIKIWGTREEFYDEDRKHIVYDINKKRPKHEKRICTEGDFYLNSIIYTSIDDFSSASWTKPTVVYLSSQFTLVIITTVTNTTLYTSPRLALKSI